MAPALDGWQPLTISELAELLGDVAAPWWVAGGWAVDLHLGRRTRVHDDLDVLVLRMDLPEIREALRAWDLQMADPPGLLNRWRVDADLPARVHDVWCRPLVTAPWAMQLLVDDSAGADWLYRRDPRIRRAVSTLASSASTAQRRVLAPEAQLLYKSHRPRPKDVNDFARTVILLVNSSPGTTTGASQSATGRTMCGFGAFSGREGAISAHRSPRSHLGVAVQRNWPAGSRWACLTFPNVTGSVAPSS